MELISNGKAVAYSQSLFVCLALFPFGSHVIYHISMLAAFQSILYNSFTKHESNTFMLFICFSVYLRFENTQIMNKENTRQMGIDFKLFPADMIQIFHKIVWKIPERNRENATFLFHTNTRSFVDYLSN